MDWFRRHVKTGSRLALFALAIQFALSFGHFHGEIIKSPIADAGPVVGTALAASSEIASQPSGHDTDRHLADCAICAVISLANNFLHAAPPLLELPHAIAIRPSAIGAEFAHLDTFRSGFRSRAPPVS